MDRLFVVLTVAEAAALVAQCDLNPVAASLSAIVKIRAAVNGATSTSAPAAALHPLLRPKSDLTVDQYVPWRDEAGGAYK